MEIFPFLEINEYIFLKILNISNKKIKIQNILFFKKFSKCKKNIRPI